MEAHVQNWCKTNDSRDESLRNQLLIDRKLMNGDITRQIFLMNPMEGCGLYFSSESCVEVDHVIPARMGGHDGYDNWQLLHQHCHHQKTAQDRQMMQPAILVTGVG